ncbi:ABC transporter permease [Desulfoferrobacter suflitae]|uniref:ABC transporter permease n=1 Tax=Desulfoferrobacter suflitae TaxID=2865782 RepID=UPI002164E068|nr:FtsX-like permease family protein [Desulfoferrobacter suflitae]MCK8600793.1 FtsX-like permease family protein [Desulfoferrobacter suflitae]
MKWLDRQRCLMDFTLSCVWRRKGKNLGFLLVYTLIIFVVCSVIFFSNALRRQADAVLHDAPEMIVQKMMAGRQELMPLAHQEDIASIRGVRSVEPRVWGYYFHPATQTNYTLIGRKDFRHGDDAVEVGQGVLRTWGAVQEDKLYFRMVDGKALDLKIAATFSAATDLVSADLIMMSQATFRRLTGMPDQFATDFSVRVRNPQECTTIAEKITGIVPGARPILREEIVRTYSALFNWRSGYMIVILSAAILAFCISAWDKATGLSAEEKAEIGILKGVGWGTSDILGMKFWEGMTVSLAAFFAGVIGAYIHVFFFSAPFFEHALKGWSILYPSFRLRPEVNLFELAVLFFLTVVPYTFITIIPIWRVSVTDPDLVMRQG